MSTTEPPAQRPPEWGAAISAAKRGVPLVDRAEDEFTAQQAAREFAIDARTLRQAALRQRAGKQRGLRHRVIERPGRQPDAIVFRRSELVEDLAALTCVYPGCENPAPGASGRCGSHSAKGEPAVEKTCKQCGATFTRYRSWLKERAGRGRFCTNRVNSRGSAQTMRGSPRRTLRSTPRLGVSTNTRLTSQQRSTESRRQPWPTPCTRANLSFAPPPPASSDPVSSSSTARASCSRVRTRKDRAARSPVRCGRAIRARLGQRPEDVALARALP